ncbi:MULTISPECIES: MoxR family ATPase [unclassified Mycobacterium]|uniref:AAA family ATPase n=1 Tax=unclassified Mycobacterium TaxID=2642494 RepID=UPI00080033D3|nr:MULTISPECIES: MoxR family ATPase [unclassified Mycobacterium]OBH08766.1 oxidoreductase [Mycobacterium sp. E2699]OBI54784.1 oxidoreductase [Mycobacterium sp. E787]
MTFTDVAEVIKRFDAHDYLLDTGTASAIFLAVTLGRPLLLEGEPGVGKTTAAKTLAAVLDTELVRLQCYEGLTASEALYDWNYQRQLLSIRLAEARGANIEEADLYTEKYLVDRPILKCVRHRGPTPPVLLIDEIDRADDEFEALLLEFLGEAAVTVPELGTFVAERPPIAVLTSNRSRDLHDALRRRCLYHWIDYPEPARAAAIVRRTVPGATAPLIEHATQFIGHVRGLDLDKPPGVAETIDWVAALVSLGVADLVDEAAVVSLGALAKTPDDRSLIRDTFTEYSRT